MMTRRSAEAMTPIRIGGLVTNGQLVCVGCGGDCKTLPAHAQPRLQFTLLAWVPVLTEEHARAHDFPYFGGSYTPPIEIAGVTAEPGSEEAAQRYISYLYRN